MMLWIIIWPAIILSNFLASWAYLHPESFKQHFTQDQLIYFWFSLNLGILVLYLILCMKAKFNVKALWMSFPCIFMGIFLIGYTFSKLGITRTFFGAELGVVDDVKYEGFPFSLGHAQYKGFIILILGIWFAFGHTHELTATTGFWIVSFMVQMLIETGPGSVPPSPDQ
ncbi:hypothetical protein M9Y10_022906 [Tritrichomonas musculus]|uniref:Uncharacterized protein n=1 Tax=Tritrichomonas musculus TaxID=1915356 RepID=A0ABR2KTM9_9EUKA